MRQERTGQKTRRSRAFPPHTLPRNPTIFLTTPLSYDAVALPLGPLREAVALPKTRNQFTEGESRKARSQVLGQEGRRSASRAQKRGVVREAACGGRYGPYLEAGAGVDVLGAGAVGAEVAGAGAGVGAEVAGAGVEVLGAGVTAAWA